MTDVTQSDLKPCPFCGATPRRVHGDAYQDLMIWCPHGCARVERGPKAAIAAWNTRAPDPETAALRAEVERLREYETGWLIELSWSGLRGGRTCWVALSDGAFPQFRTLHHNEDYDFEKIESPLRFTAESNEALRFARKSDADAFIAKFDRYLLGPVATEHAWIIARAALSPEGEWR